MGELHWQCDCGKVRIEIAPAKGTRCVCYCWDCQAFQRHLGHPEALDAAGGSDLFQTMPYRVEVQEGAEQLACLQLSEKGPLRWYAACCNSGICNTWRSPKVPLASLTVRGFKDPTPAGAVLARVNRSGATGHIDGPKGSVRTLIVRFLAAALWARVTGRYRNTPFFQADGSPIAPVKVLSTAETEAAYGG